MMDIVLGMRGKDMTQSLSLGTNLALFLTPLWPVHKWEEHHEPSALVRAHAGKIKVHGE